MKATRGGSVFAEAALSRPLTGGAAGSGSGTELGDPTVAVVITNHNYGHFLRACINSVLDQTRPPEQLVVVDDASEDDSPQVLAEYASRIEVLRFGENRGQAAAFNAGFASTRCDLVLFLDADDLLRPEAIETVLAHYAPGLTLIFFGLEMIDAAGCSIGLQVNSLDADDGDNRPRLLRSGYLSGEYRFAPTSGNMFSRELLEAVLPMPEAAWRTCADAYLVRAAALWGPVRAVRRVLGRYRVHGGNNYVGPRNFIPWTMQRGERDIGIAAAALLSLAADLPLPGPPKDGHYVRLALRLRAVAMLACIAGWTGDVAPMRRAARRAIADTARSGMPPGDLLAALAVLAGPARAHPGSPQLRDWAIGLLAAAPARGRLETRLAELERPRWPEALPYDTHLVFGEMGLARNVLADGWLADSGGQRVWSRGVPAALEFRLEPTADLARVELGLAAAPDAEQDACRLSVTCNGAQVWSGALTGSVLAEFTVSRDALLPEQLVRIEVMCEAPTRAGRQTRRPRFAIEHLRAQELATPRASPFLAPNVAVPPASLLPEGDDGGWVAARDGSISLARAEGRLRFAVGPGIEPLDLLLRLAEPVAPGWLKVSCLGADVFNGETGGANALQVLLPFQSRQFTAEVELRIAFSPADPVSGSDFGLVALALQPRSSEKDPHRLLAYRGPPVAVLNVGEVLRPKLDERCSRVFGTGWQRPLDGRIRNGAAEARLNLRLPAGVTGATLRLELRPVLPPREGFRHVVGVSSDGTMRAVFELVGEGTVAVQLGEAVPSDGSELAVTLHSVYAPAAGGEATPAPGSYATFELTALGFVGRVPAEVPSLPPPGAAEPGTDLLARIEAAATAVRDGEGLDGLLAHRRGLAQALRRLGLRGLELIASESNRLRAVEALGAATLGMPLAPEEQNLLHDLESRASGETSPGDRLRLLVAAMLLTPAFRMPLEPDLGAIPAILVRQPEVLARYLGRDPEFASVREVSTYVAYLTRLLLSIEGVLDWERPGSALYALALRVLYDLRCTKSIFGRDNLRALNRLRSRCIEKVLARAGAPLALPRRPRMGGRRLRLGVMVRHLAPAPDTWAVLGMYRGLDRSRFDLTLITIQAREGEVSAEAVFPRRLSLAGLPADAAVAAIRELDLDLFILGAYTTGLERVGEIVAHRLARLQVSSCFNCPTTLGFRSFDLALAWSGIVARDAQGQHVERLIYSAASLQCCFVFTGIEGATGDPPTDVLDSLGPRGATVRLASTAMAHKILPDLMAAWARILARTEQARLVLFPFAGCWSMPYAEESFRRRLETKLEAEGVAPERVLILAEQPPEHLRALLGACDLYLDSFPYTGATTVCEALACGLPIVTLAGEMLREQTGAAWARAYGLPELVAVDEAGYVNLAVHLASEPRTRAAAAAQLARVLAGGTPPHADSAAFGAALSNALWDAAEDSGLFPMLASGQSASREVEDGVPPSVVEPPHETAQGEGRAAPSATEVDASMVRVVMLTMPRSGSTALCQLIGQSEGAEMHFELFHATEIQYRTGRIADPGPLAERDAQPVAFLEETFAEARRHGARLAGFKFFAFHKRRVLQRIIEDPGIKVVYLSRSNTLAQYASRRIAETTGRWERAAGEPAELVRVPFDAADFEGFQQSMQQWTSEISSHLAAAGREALFLEYRSMLSEASIARLSAFLGVAVPPPTGLRTARQNAERTIDRFTNPETVRRYLDLRNKALWAYGG